MSRTTLRLPAFIAVTALIAIAGCLEQPTAPTQISALAPAAPKVPSGNPLMPMNDSLEAPVDTTRPAPDDTLETTRPGDTLERPTRGVLSENEPTTPPPPPPAPGDVELGLLADLTPLGTLYGPADNWWNLDVSGAPLDPNSDEIITTIQGYESSVGGLHPDFTPNFGIPYAVVGDETPLVPVEFRNRSESDTGAPGYPTGYPIPADAITNHRFRENGGGLTGDRHLLLYHRDQRMVFELSYAEYEDGRWTAGYGAVFKIDENYRRPDGWTSTDAAGLCVLAGLVRYDEAYGPEPIRHALRVSIKRTNGYVWPASHEGASDAGAPPLGMRLRLKDSVDLSGYTPAMRKIFQAMKTYGLIVADRGGNMYVQGTMDERWKSSEINPAFHTLDASDFEVVKLGWKPTS